MVTGSRVVVIITLVKLTSCFFQPSESELPMRHIESIDDFSKSVCNFLIKSNAKINIEDRYGQTPLHYCAMRGNEIVTKELLSLPGINFEVSLISSVLLTWIFMYMAEKTCR